jgi:hypothetical protein
MSYQPVKKTSEENQRNFRDAYDRLVQLNRSFDEGRLSAAGGIAASVYAIAYDASRSQPSALTNINRKHEVMFLDTARPLTGSGASVTPPLVGCTLSTSGMSYFPLKEYAEKRTERNFEEWWDVTVLRTESGASFTRGNLITYFRHEHGAHVAEQFTSQHGQPASEFAELARGGAIKGQMVSSPESDRDFDFLEISEGSTQSSGSVPIYGPEYASVRQIGWEIEQSVFPVCRDIIERKSLNTEFPMRES